MWPGVRHRHRDRQRLVLVAPVLTLVQEVGEEVGLPVEGAHGGNTGGHHAHWVGVVVEALGELLAHVLVNEGVMRVDDEYL